MVSSYHCQTLCLKIKCLTFQWIEKFMEKTSIQISLWNISTFQFLAKADSALVKLICFCGNLVFEFWIWQNIVPALLKPRIEFCWRPWNFPVTWIIPLGCSQCLLTWWTLKLFILSFFFHLICSCLLLKVFQTLSSNSKGWFRQWVWLSCDYQNCAPCYYDKKMLYGFKSNLTPVAALNDSLIFFVSQCGNLDVMDHSVSTLSGDMASCRFDL